MFKWVCLGVAAGFLAVFLWMVNDLRLQVRATAERVRTVSDRVTEDLPPLVERTRETTGVLSASLPKVVERVNHSTEVVAANLPKTIEQVNRTTEVVAELAEDIRQLKELLGVQATVRDKSLVAYANNSLTLVEKSGGTIGTKKVVGKGLKGTRPAAEWAASARKEAFFLALLGRSRKELLHSLTRTKLGAAWMIELPGKEPLPLLDWLKANDPETRKIE